MRLVAKVKKRTVKLVYKDHPRNQQNAFLHRWSLYAGLIRRKVIILGLVKGGLYKQMVFIQVVFICRFNNMESNTSGTCKGGLYKQVVLYTGGLYSRFDCILIMK